jgi:hypothetical protein
MRSVLSALFLCATLATQAEDFPLRFAADGQLILTNLPSAPFPHPQRAEGHTYKGKLYPANQHYSDNTVAIFVPKNFRETSEADFVVHFHGWNNNVTNTLDRYGLIDQLIASKRNAILVVPEGPRNAPDSFGGKLEDADGFKKFMADVLAALRANGRLKKSELGRIILSGHSGGYEVMSSIVAVGGLPERIREVWLFDALYARTEKFVNWFEHQHGRLVDIYTENGGTRRESENLIAQMKEKNHPLLETTEEKLTDATLRTNQLVFIFTPLAHDEVVQKHQTFQQFLETSCFAEIPPAKSSK